MWIKFSNRKGHHDEFYRPVSKEDETWKSIMQTIHYELDEQYALNNENTVGIKFSVEIVDKLPPDIEWEDE